MQTHKVHQCKVSQPLIAIHEVLLPIVGMNSESEFKCIVNAKISISSRCFSALFCWSGAPWTVRFLAEPHTVTQGLVLFQMDRNIILGYAQKIRIIDTDVCVQHCNIIA